MLRSIAVAFDGSAPSQRALDLAVELAKLASASLTIVGVVPAPIRFTTPSGEHIESETGERRYMPELLSRFAEPAGRRLGGRVETVIREGSVVDELLTFVDDRRPDLLVLGARGLSTARRILMGSVSDAVVHHATCSVLVVRPPPGEPGGTPGAGTSTPSRDSPGTPKPQVR